MLKMISSMELLNFGQLASVYEESICKDGAANYSRDSENLQYLQAKQDFYAYLQCFFLQERSSVCIWVPRGEYKAALRLEPYRDGLLISGLETAPNERKKGYASALINSVVEKMAQCGQIPLYSHVEKSNLPSISVHRACGFDKILDYGVYSDGSVFPDSFTFCRK